MKTEFKNRNNLLPTKLQEISKIQSGFHSRKRILENPDSDFCLLRAEDFNQDRTFRPKKLIHFSTEREPSRYLVHHGDILFQSKGTSNVAYHINQEVKNTIASGSFFRIRVTDHQVLPEYLAWWLNQELAQSYFREQASGSYISYVSITTLKNLKVPIPSIPIQEKIIAINLLWEKEKQLSQELVEKKSLLIKKVCLASFLKKELDNG